MNAHNFFHFFFFNDTATTEIYTLSLHDALPIYRKKCDALPFAKALPPIYIASEPNNRSNALESRDSQGSRRNRLNRSTLGKRSEEHTSELQSRQYLVCRLLLEKKNNTKFKIPIA